MHEILSYWVLMVWEKSGGAFYAMVADVDGRPSARLIAEERPDGGWDWAAWSEGARPNTRSGTTRTAREAMHAAERAAEHEA
jgi:hypothetical protein